MSTSAPGSPIADTIRTILDELGQQFFERREALHAIWIGLLSGTNTYLLGDPGTGKSLMVRESSRRVPGANYWETLLDRQLPMESIFGPIDIIEFRDTGKYHRQTDGYAPWAHFLFLDEVGKAGPATLNPLLTLLNEGIYHNNSTPMQCNILTAVGASNEQLEEELAAMWDRWMLRLIIEPIQEPSNFAALLQRGAEPVANPTTVTLDEIVQARDKEVPQVTLGSGVVDTIMDLKVALRAQQVTPSDRRWRQSVRVLQAAAWLQGRSAVDEDDLAILRFILWDVAEQISTVEKLVLERTSEIASKAMEYAEVLAEINSGIDSRKGESIEKLAQFGATSRVKTTKIEKEIHSLLEKAEREGRNTSKLKDVRDQVRATKKRIFVECLNVPEDKAEANS